MNFIEAVREMQKGKKVRREDDITIYYLMGFPARIKWDYENENGFDIFPDDVLADDWRVVE